MTRRGLGAAALMVLVGCSQPTADELPDGTVPIVPALPATDVAAGDGAAFLLMTPRTPVGRITDETIRGQRAAEIVAAIGRDGPPAFLPACTAAGEVLVVIPDEDGLEDARQAIYAIVRGLDFADITPPEVVPAATLADLTCAADSRPLR